MTRYSLRFTTEQDAQIKARAILREYPYTIVNVYKAGNYWIVDVQRGTSCD